MNIQPINDNIVVKLPEMEKEIKSQGGLVLPQPSLGQPKQDRGIVVAIGDGRITSSGELVAMKVDVNDEIIFNRFAGTEMIIGEEKYLIIKECDVLAKIK